MNAEHIAQTLTALVGDAILAGVACGIYQTVAEGVKAMVRLQAKVLPGENVDAYQKAYERYCGLDNSLADYFKQNY